MENLPQETRRNRNVFFHNFLLDFNQQQKVTPIFPIQIETIQEGLLEFQKIKIHVLLQEVFS